jgi:CRP-like cAMP-binding protein
MITPEDLKNVPRLADLTEAMRGRLAAIAAARSFNADEVMYERGQAARFLHILKRGKAVLESDLTPKVSVSIVSLKPGYIFGRSALIPGATHVLRAVSTETSDVILLPGDEVRALMDQDNALGYIFMRAMFQLLHDRLNHRTEQFLKILARHPDLQLAP